MAEADRQDWRDLLVAAQRAATADDEEEVLEAWADLNALSSRSLTMAVAVQLVKIQLERPVVLPLAALMCGHALITAVHAG
jgi:hypothetical protein